MQAISAQAPVCASHVCCRWPKVIRVRSFGQLTKPGMADEVLTIVARVVV